MIKSKQKVIFNYLFPKPSLLLVGDQNVDSCCHSLHSVLFPYQYWLGKCPFTPLQLCKISLVSAQLLLGSIASLPNHMVGYIHTSFLWLALSHTCCNPVIYLGMNMKVHQLFQHLFQHFQSQLQVRFRFLKLVSSAPCLRKCSRNQNR